MNHDRKTILVGLDFFDSSIAALAEAIRIREWTDARLIAAHVIDERLWHQLAEEFHLSEDEVTHRAETRMRNEIIEVAGASSEIESAIMMGHPVKEMLSACNKYQADLMVLGAQGLKESKSTSLGNVATRLLRNAPIDLLLVRRSQSHPFRKVFACVDLSDASDSVVEKAIDIANQDQAELTIIHVMPHLQDLPTLRSPLEALGFYEIKLEGPPQLGLIKKANEDLEILLERHRHRIHRAHAHTHLVANDDATNGLLHAADEAKAELLVIGKHGHSRLLDISVGSTAEKVAHRAAQSVLFVA